MTKSTQSVSFEVDVSANIDARMVRNDYGVPGSPVWYEAEDHDFAYFVIDIAGVNVSIKALPIELRNAILECAIDACDENGWERYDD